MNYSDLEKVNVFFADAKKIILGILLGLLVVFIFRGCNPQPTADEQTISKNEIDKQKEIANDYKYQFDVLEIENKKLVQEKDSLKAIAELSKNNLYQLQHQSKRPIYIEKIADCNDTLQKVYDFSVKKDSSCNLAIQNLDNVIFSQDSTIDIQNRQKTLLLSSLLVKDNLLRNEEKNAQNLTESVKNERQNKNIWKTATFGAVIIIGKLVLFK